MLPSSCRPLSPRHLRTNDHRLYRIGPFVFQPDEWVPGSKVVYTKFADYVPRDEPASGAAGGKIVNFDRVEWLYIPDQTTAMNALMSGR